MELKIERNYHNGGWACIFEYEGQEYYADVCLIPYSDYTECMIFKSEDGQLTLRNAGNDLYCKRNIPVTKDALRECIMEFIEELATKS